MEGEGQGEGERKGEGEGQGGEEGQGERCQLERKPEIKGKYFLALNSAL